MLFEHLCAGDVYIEISAVLFATISFSYRCYWNL